MIAATPASGVEHIAQVLTKTEAALGELHHYYKFGRHTDVFPEKPYFLFSHCGHLLFSLWLLEADSEKRIFNEDSRLSRIIQQLDFNALRYSEYKRRMLHADAYEEHLQNEPTWFRFWIKAIEVLDGSTVSQSRAFPQKLLRGTMQDGSLEGKPNRKKRQALQNLVRSGEAGRLILRSTWILEDMIAAVASHSLTMHPQKHAIVRVQVLTGLLQRLRRHIVLDSAVKGTYALSVDPTWGLPSALSRLWRNRTQGELTVAPVDEGGTINCTYTWTSGRKQKTQSWTQEVSALQQDYEDTLFKTWSYDTGQYLQGIDDSFQTEACWVVDDLEANDLETISQQADRLLESFAALPAYGGFVEKIAGVLRNGRPQWQPRELSWNYVKRLDRIVERLRFVCREAKVLGGADPVAQVIVNLWPPQQWPLEETTAADPAAPAAKEEQDAESAPCDRATETEQDPVATAGVCRDVEAAEDRNESESLDSADVPLDTTYTPEKNAADVHPEVSAEPAQTQDTHEARTKPESVEAGSEPTRAEAAPDVESTKDRNRDEPSDSVDLPVETVYAPEGGVTDSNPETAGDSADTQDPATEESQACCVETEPSQSSPEHAVERPAPCGQAGPSEPAAGQDAREDEAVQPPQAETVASDKEIPDEPAPAATRLAPSQINRKAACEILLRHLSKYHGLPEESRNRRPLLSREIQEALQWSPATVQRAMGDIFGKKPFTVYKAQCSAGLICSGLCAFERKRGGTLEVDDEKPCLHTAGVR